MATASGNRAPVPVNMRSPIHRSAGRCLELGAAAKVDLRWVEPPRHAPGAPSGFGRAGPHGAVLHIDQVAAVRLQRVARVQARPGCRSRSGLKIRPHRASPGPASHRPGPYRPGWGWPAQAVHGAGPTSWGTPTSTRRSAKNRKRGSTKGTGSVMGSIFSGCLARGWRMLGGLHNLLAGYT